MKYLFTVNYYNAVKSWSSSDLFTKQFNVKQFYFKEN